MAKATTHLMVLALVGSAGIALAAPASAQERNWTGFYVGLNAGWARAESDVRTSVCNIPAFGAFSSCFWSSNAGATINAAGRGKTDDSLFTFGGQTGYNFQDGSLVYGLEADLNSLKSKASRSATIPYPAALFGANMGATFNETVKTTYFATVRPRIGIASGSILYFVTGGLAITNLKSSHSYQEFGFGAGCSSGTNYCDVPGSKSDTKYGWTVGGGAEWALDSHWSLKAEYLYADFGSVKSVSDMNPFTTALGSPELSFINHSADLTVQTVRAGINYKF